MLRVAQATDVKEALRKMAAFFTRPLFGTKRSEDDPEVVFVKGRLGTGRQFFVLLLFVSPLLLLIAIGENFPDLSLKHYLAENLCKSGWRGYSQSLLVTVSIFWLILLSAPVMCASGVINGLRIYRARATSNPDKRTWFNRRIYLGRKAAFIGCFRIFIALMVGCLFVYMLPLTISMTEDVLLIRPEQIKACQQALPSAL